MPINLRDTVMPIKNSRRGAGLIDLMIMLFLLTTAGILFSTAFPTAFATSAQSQSRKLATAVAQRKMEQLRAMNYESLTQPLLLSAGVIDSSPGSSPYSFTTVDSLAGQFTAGTGTLEITDVSADVKRVRVTLSWQGMRNSGRRSIQLTTLFADRRTRRVN